MADARPNIVQAEFFLARTLNQDDVLLKDVIREIRERTAEGGLSKLSVRFYDRDGSITRFVARAKKCESKSRALLEIDWNNLSRFKKWWFGHESRRLAHKEVAARAEAQKLAMAKLTESVRAMYPIAIEGRYDGPLRQVKQSELHELLESARAATGVWFFIFNSNDLFADSNKPVANYSL